MPTQDFPGSSDLWFPTAPGISSIGAVSLTKTPVYVTDENGDPVLDGNGNQIVLYYDLTVSKVVPVWNQSTNLQGRIKIGCSVDSLPYALQNTAATLPLKVLTRLVMLFEPSRVSGTEAPVLGDAQVSPTSTATDDGWTLAYNNTADEGNTTVTGFGFNFTLNSVSYTGCFVNSNAFITFGSSVEAYQNLDADMPSLPKLHVGSDDFSYQRIYTKAETGLFRIRWEGNSAFNASAGSSNRFFEVTFYKPTTGGTQFLEVRSGDISGGTSGPFMLATATTALATDTFAANESWVFEGNATGTTWSVYPGEHVVV